MANMISNPESREQKEPRNGGQQAGSAPQSGLGRAASSAAGLATKQAQRTRDRFEEQLTEQRTRLSGRVRTLGRALHGAGEMLEEDDLAAQALHYASGKIDGVAGYVAELTPSGVAEDLRSVAQTRPIWFFGGAFVLGLALARFARSTAEGTEGAPSAGRRLSARHRDDSSQAAGTPAGRAGMPKP